MLLLPASDKESRQKMMTKANALVKKDMVVVKHQLTGRKFK